MKKLGFTLAEVLITLVIIGVIAAMTVPTLMSNTNAQEFRAALKKAISGANQALTLHYALTSESAIDMTGGASQLVNEIFRKRMSVLGNEGDSVDFSIGDCSGTSFVTADGIMFCVSSDFASASCDSYNSTPCGSNGGQLWIDVNGYKAPNKLTDNPSSPKDIYRATIYAQRVVPYGSATQQVMYEVGQEGAKTTSTSSSSSSSSSGS